MKILVSDPLSEEGLTILRDSGIPVDVKPGLTEDELCAIIGEYDGLVIRSGTKVTKKVIEASKCLRVVGRAGVGVDNVDIPAATEKGVLVMNTPSANILSAAEHTCAMILAAARKIPQAHESMHKGEWKRSKFSGIELNGKTLGIIGVGRVGGEVARRLKHFNMKLVGYDPFLPPEVAADIGVRLTTLDEVIEVADIMTIHTPLLPETRNMISMPQFKKMKPGAILVNVARGGIVNEDDLYDALKEKVIAGAAFDVWCEEPLCEHEQKLLELENLVTTPHLGASTVEAQERVAVEIAESVIKYLRDGEIVNAINAPRGKMDPVTAQFLPLAERLGMAAAQLNGQRPIDNLEVSFNGELSDKNTRMLNLSILIGIMKSMVGQGNANIVNVESLAKSKGISVKETKNKDAVIYDSTIGVRIETKGDVFDLVGTIVAREPRLVGINGFRFEIPMHGGMLLARYRDTPGTIGKVGKVLGDNGVNIAMMSVGRDAPMGTAVMALSVDDPISEDVLKMVDEASGFEDSKYIFIE